MKKRIAKKLYKKVFIYSIGESKNQMKQWVISGLYLNRITIKNRSRNINKLKEFDKIVYKLKKIIDNQKQSTVPSPTKEEFWNMI